MQADLYQWKQKPDGKNDLTLRNRRFVSFAADHQAGAQSAPGRAAGTHEWRHANRSADLPDDPARSSRSKACQRAVRSTNCTGLFLAGIYYTHCQAPTRLYSREIDDRFGQGHLWENTETLMPTRQVFCSRTLLVNRWRAWNPAITFCQGSSAVSI